MSYQPKDMSGNLFKNDKGGNEKRPDYRGEACIDDEIFEVAGWIKEGAKGKFLSLAFKPKEDQAEPPRQVKAAPAVSDVDDDIPF